MDKRRLLKATLAEAEVEIPGKGTVRVRALSRSEVLDKLNTVDRSVPGAWECRWVALSLVDPVLTEDEVRQWRDTSHHEEIGAVLAKLDELTALTKDAAKDAYKELEASPDAEFRDAPGEGSGHDGGAAEG